MVRRFARNWLPPVITRKLTRFRIHFAGPFDDWNEARARANGYDSSDILEHVKEATLKVKRGEAAFERDSVTFDAIEYSWPLLSGLMWVAARAAGSLRVLDFGGSLGSSYFQHRRWLDALAEVKWGVIEQPHFVEYGNAEIACEELKFFESIDSCAEDLAPNVVLLSSALQYLPNPFEVLNELKAIGTGAMIIDRTPFSDMRSDRIYVQHVPPRIYKASYPTWIFSRAEFHRYIQSQWIIHATFKSGDSQDYVVSGTQIEFDGMILREKTD